ncbi:MAG: CdaR family protein [Abditibacteriales bacterium]|nr:CdaR family protein [Abditibacteriales bacterium]MDW8368019.1 CdaR family protein [Abditibacteriales bacterium]
MKGFFSSMFARLTQNLGYKLLALILAFWWWSYAQSQQYPRETRTVSVKAQVIRAGSYVLLNGEPTVRVRISGFRDDLNAFDAGSLKATLDLSRAIPGRQQTLPVLITAPANSPVELLDRKVEVEVTVDTLLKKRWKVESHVEGTSPRFQVSHVTIKPHEVIVQGPASRLQRVRRVYVRLTLTGARPMQMEELPIEVVDAMGVAVPDVEATPSRVSVAVSLRETQAFPIAPPIVGSPAAGFRITGWDYEPKTILLSGESSVLKSLKAVPTEPIDITGARGNVRREIGLRLPDGVTAQGPERVSVEVHIAPEPPAPPTHEP